MNAILHAQNITGVSTVAAYIGGMHLTTSSDSVIAQTVAGFQSLHVGYVAPMHGTGNRAVTSIANNMPSAFVPPSVGSRLLVGVPSVTPPLFDRGNEFDHGRLQCNGNGVDQQ